MLRGFNFFGINGSAIQAGVSLNRIFILLIILFLLPFNSFGQKDSLRLLKLRSEHSVNPVHSNPCMTDVIMQRKMKEDAEFESRMKNAETITYKRQLDKLSNNKRLEGLMDLYTIPVVVHIIHNNGSENISDAQVLLAIQHLNSAYRKQAPYNGQGVDVGIEFCLASTDENGNATTGINRVVSSLTSHDMDVQETQLKNLKRWDPTKYVNIWIVKEICSDGTCNNVLGYAYLAASHGMPYDGLVIDADYFGSSSDNSKVAVHEMGHYLNLYHTFNGGCANDNCLTDGDKVCDTPPDQSTERISCGSTENTCHTDSDDPSISNPFRSVSLGGLGDQNDMTNNYMDYSTLACMNTFTQGQKDRMIIGLTTLRSSLLTSRGCSTPCRNNIVAGFTPSTTTTVNVGTTINFTNTTTGANSYEWKINGTVFSSALNSSYTFNTEGSYNITITASNSDATCTKSFTLTIEVKCTVTASFAASRTKINIGNSIYFISNSSGATNYQWFINNSLQGNARDLNFTFNTKGNYLVYLVSDNDICSDTSDRLIISVGTTEQDCMDAIPVCQAIYHEDNSYIGPGNIEEAGQSSCLALGENSSVWYIFTITKSGLLDLDIIPNDMTDDYDFAIYNLTNANCSDIISGNASEVRCNYSAKPGITGLTAGAIGISNSASMPNRCAPLDVRVGETYVLLLDNFSRSNSGYTLYFYGSANIFDPLPPKVQKLDYNHCTQVDTIEVFMSKPVLCSSIQNDGTDFYITGASTHPIKKAYSEDCNAGNFTNVVKVILDIPIVDGSTYELHYKNGTDGNTLIDNCGNALSPNDFNKILLNLSASVNLGNDTTICRSYTLNAGAGFFKYHWQNGSSSQTFNVTTAGKYWVEVENDCHIKASDTIYIDFRPDIKPNLGNDISVCQGEIAVLHAGPDFKNYLWNDHSSDSTLTVWKPGKYWVRTENFCGNIYTDTLRFNYVSPPLSFQILDQYCIESANAILSATPSGGTFSGTNVNNNILNLTAAGEGVQTVIYNYTYHGCSFTASKQTEIITCDAIDPETFLIPNLITRNNDNKNDYFEIRGLKKPCNVEIFNTWGDEVYKKDKYDQSWNGGDLADGVYYYVITIPSHGLEYKGWVHLVK